MGMRLLPKSEVDQLKQQEQKTAVEEGAKLARRVDNLRETAASEEQSLREFREKTVAQIHEDTKKEQEKLEIVKRERKAAEEARDEALKPLTEKEEELKKEREALDKRGEELDSQESDVLDRENTVEEIEKELVNIADRTKRDAELVRSQLKLADETTAKADLALKNAREHEIAAERLKNNLGRELTHREEVVTSREESATIREAKIAEEKKALADGWKLLRDRELMLERNLKRN